MKNNKNSSDVAKIIGAAYLAEKGFEEAAFFSVRFNSTDEIVDQCDKIIQMLKKVKFVFQCNEEDEEAERVRECLEKLDENIPY